MKRPQMDFGFFHPWTNVPRIQPNPKETLMKDNTVSSGSDVIALLFSGGIDSTALLGYIISQGDIPFVINIDYGASNNLAEAQALDKIIHWYDQRGYTIRRLDLQIDNSVMFAEQVSKGIPNQTFEEMSNSFGNQTIFPGRNAVLISMASAAALARNITTLYAGMALHDQEANFPDCSSHFIRYMAAALDVGYDMQFRTPFFDKPRSEVIRGAYEHKVPLHLTYSCYRGGSVHCGQCPTCYSRQQSFEAAGFIDPTNYQGGRIPDIHTTGLEEWNVQDW